MQEKTKRYGGIKRSLPHDFEPTIHTVICGRGRDSFGSQGNCRFRSIVKALLPEYEKAGENKLEKSFVISNDNQATATPFEVTLPDNTPNYSYRWAQGPISERSKSFGGNESRQFFVQFNPSIDQSANLEEFNGQTLLHHFESKKPHR